MQPTIKTRRFSPKAALSLMNGGIDSLHARLFSARGISEMKDLNSDIAGLIPPSEMLNTDLAATILADIVINQKVLVVSGDFDVDGTASIAVALRALRMMGLKKNLHFAMPHRGRHSYGLSPLLVKEIHAKYAPDFILTVDCGTSSFEGVDEANRLGIQSIISDHHLCAADRPLPNALCIVNPQQPNCEFSSKNICGCGVIFYIMLALRAKLRQMDYFTSNNIPDPNLASLLDLVAMATIADVVKLDQNNMRLVNTGIMRIRAGRGCAGINALIAVSGREQDKVSSQDIAFLQKSMPPEESKMHQLA